MKEITLVTEVTITDMVVMGYDMDYEMVLGTIGGKELGFVKDCRKGLYFLIESDTDFRRLCRYYQSIYTAELYKGLFAELKKEIVAVSSVAYLPEFTEEVF